MTSIYDQARRRRGVRRGRERGCWLYVPGEVLAEVGVNPKDAPPWYRIWTRRKTLLVQLYDEP
jgi:hypothetical protein